MKANRLSAGSACMPVHLSVKGVGGIAIGLCLCFNLLLMTCRSTTRQGLTATAWSDQVQPCPRGCAGSGMSMEVTCGQASAGLISCNGMA